MIVEKKSGEKIGLASDHAGFKMKDHLKLWLTEQGYEPQDFGCFTDQACDYPDFAHPLAKAVSEDICRFGISLCGSGNGINMTVNKYPAIRSALCWNTKIAALARSHNDANICALPARFLSPSDAVKIVSIFLETAFDGGRHLRRIEKIPVH